MTVLAVGVATLAVGAVVGAGSSLAAGRTAEKIADRNAAIGRIQAVDTLARGEEEVQFVGLQKKAIKGEQVAAFAGQNVDLGSDVVSSVSLNTDLVIESEIESIRNNAARQAWGLAVGAQNVQFGGDVAKRQGVTQAVSSLLGGTANIALAAS